MTIRLTLCERDAICYSVQCSQVREIDNRTTGTAKTVIEPVVPITPRTKLRRYSRVVSPGPAFTLRHNRNWNYRPSVADDDAIYTTRKSTAETA